MNLEIGKSSMRKQSYLMHLNLADYLEKSGGLTEAIKEGVKTHDSNFDVMPYIGDGIEQCKAALKALKNGTLIENFLEGMACVDGCIGGPGCLKHEMRDKIELAKFAEKSSKKLPK